MIATRFRSVWLVAAVAVAALFCYLISQRVAAERAELALIERDILRGQQAIRHLRMEIMTRSRMPQLERWNAAVLGLAAPGARQFMDSEVRLASLNQATPLPLDPTVEAKRGAVRSVAYQPASTAPAAPAAQPAAPAPAAPEPLLRQATYIRPKAERIAPEPVKAVLLPDDIGRIARMEQASAKPGAR
ncbi:hypothetical protein CLG96_08465 [Sphingomonas oleivorans]|uniref:Uncharacterized protein n=1 Tax=Sphingomonas oleivorans TaxID=1735121 RepID=A0A2T5FY60_9SPHN|nr:hypothetical protein [Sphingomonas oleivorans]PTQ11469.1 hypothetical protein CLG96_08465 [Sphingomonas oleivorans]